MSVCVCIFHTSSTLSVTHTNKLTPIPLAPYLYSLSTHPLKPTFATHTPQVSQLTAALEAQSRQADGYLTTLDAVKGTNEELAQEKEILMVEINALRVSVADRKEKHDGFTSDITVLRETLQAQCMAETALLSQCQTLQAANEAQVLQRASLIAEITELKRAADHRERLFNDLVESLSAAEQVQMTLSVELER